MKLSEKTTTILKNFAGINQSIMIKSGNKIRTISITNTIYAEAEVEETFPKDFGIYDLPQFLSGFGLHKDPEIDFSNEKYLLIKEGKYKSKFFCASEKTIRQPPDKEISLKSEEVEFKLTEDQLNKLNKAASVYQLPDLSVIGDGRTVQMVVRDKRNETSNDFSIVVGETDLNFVFNFKVENIKILSGSYDVIISKEKLSMFRNTKYNLNYFVALEKDSTFN